MQKDRLRQRSTLHVRGQETQLGWQQTYRTSCTHYHWCHLGTGSCTSHNAATFRSTWKSRSTQESAAKTRDEISTDSDSFPYRSRSICANTVYRGHSQDCATQVGWYKQTAYCSDASCNSGRLLQTSTGCTNESSSYNWSLWCDGNSHGRSIQVRSSTGESSTRTGLWCCRWIHQSLCYLTKTGHSYWYTQCGQAGPF